MKEMKYQKESIMEVLHSGEYLGRKFAIISRGTHPVAYVELKTEETEKSRSYDDYNLSVHGGFTYLGEAYWDKNDKGTYIGWDYAHCDDYTGCGMFSYFGRLRTKYTTQEIFNAVKSVIEQFEKAEWVDVSKPHFQLNVKED